MSKNENYNFTCNHCGTSFSRTELVNLMIIHGDYSIVSGPLRVT
jgi:hypothetical protein